MFDVDFQVTFATPCMMFSYPNHSTQYEIPQSSQRHVIRVSALIKMTDGRQLIYLFVPQLGIGFLRFVLFFFFFSQDCHEPYLERNHTCLSVDIFKYSRSNFGRFLMAWRSVSPDSFFSLKNGRWADTWVIIHKAVPFKIIISYCQQTDLNSRKRRDFSRRWGFETTLRSARRAVSLCVFLLAPLFLGLSVCVFTRATSSRPLCVCFYSRH